MVDNLGIFENKEVQVKNNGAESNYPKALGIQPDGNAYVQVINWFCSFVLVTVEQKKIIKTILFFLV